MQNPPFLTMRISLTSLLALLALTGCGLTHTLDPSAGGERLADANRRFAERPATVRLATGETRAAVSLHVAPDTTTWLDPETGALWAVPTQAVSEVTRHDRVRTRRHFVRQQLVFGAVLGGLGGAFMGDVFARGFPFGETDASTGRRAAGLVAGAAVGAGLGAAQAMATGSLFSETASDVERYVVVPPRVQPVPPDSSARGLPPR